MYRAVFVISTAVILNGGYNYTFRCVYTKYINQPHGKARGGRVSPARSTRPTMRRFLYINQKKWGAFCGAILSKKRAARYRSLFGVYSIVLKTLLFFGVFSSKDRPPNALADVAFGLPPNALIIVITYGARHNVCWLAASNDSDEACED